MAAVAQIVATLLFAGLVLRSLSTATVLLVNGVVTGAAISIAARSADLPRRVYREWAAMRNVRVRPTSLRDAWAWVLGVAVVIETAYLALAAYVLPSAAWDAMTYHLVAVASWIRGDRILITPLRLFANVYPMNGELTFLWVASLTRSDLLVDLPQLAFAIIGAIAVAAIARTVGVSKSGAIVAASLYLLTPIVLAQATSDYVDLVLPGLFLAGFAFLLRYLLAENQDGDMQAALARRPATQLVFAGVACGLAVGSKSTGALYGAVAALVLVGNLVWWRRRRQLSWRACGIRLTAFLLPIVALGSFWYVRTWVEYGTPTYPYSVSVAGVEVFSGVDPSSVNVPPDAIRKYSGPLRTLASWAHLTSGYTYDQRLDGLGPQWLLLELPALVLFAVYCALRRRLLFFNFVLPFTVIVALTPSNWWSRLTVLLVAPGAVALVFLIEQIRRRSIVLLLEAATIVLVVAGCALSAKRITVLQHSFPAATVLPDATKPRSERTLGKLVLPEYGWTDTVPRNSRIGVDPIDVPNNFLFPLFGTDFRNEVIALSTRDLTSDSLRTTLQRSHIDYFVTRKHSPRDDIAKANPQALEPVSAVGDLRVYRVRV